MKKIIITVGILFGIVCHAMEEDFIKELLLKLVENGSVADLEAFCINNSVNESIWKSLDAGGKNPCLHEALRQAREAVKKALIIVTYGDDPLRQDFQTGKTAVDVIAMLRDKDLRELQLLCEQCKGGSCEKDCESASLLISEDSTNKKIKLCSFESDGPFSSRKANCCLVVSLGTILICFPIIFLVVTLSELLT